MELEIKFPFWVAYAANLQLIRWSLPLLAASAVFPLMVVPLSFGRGEESMRGLKGLVRIGAVALGGIAFAVGGEIWLVRAACGRLGGRVAWPGWRCVTGIDQEGEYFIWLSGWDWLGLFGAGTGLSVLLVLCVTRLTRRRSRRVRSRSGIPAPERR